MIYICLIFTVIVENILHIITITIIEVKVIILKANTVKVVIQKLQKKIGEKGITKKDDNKYANMAKESEMITLEEQIQKEFLTIQKKINENFVS